MLNHFFYAVRMTTEYILTRSKNKNKKLALQIIPEQGRGKTVNFGAKSYDDFTKTHDEA